ncbi:MAG: tyrosine-type recombinase/integrase [Geminicoccaceae bacterium]
MKEVIRLSDGRKITVTEKVRKDMKGQPVKWQVDYHDNAGKRQRPSYDSLPEARREAERISKRLDQATELATADASSISFERAYRDFFLLYEHKVSPETLRTFGSNARIVLNDWGHKKLDEIKPVDVESWALSRRTRYCRDAVRHMIGVISQVMKHARRKGWLTVNPFAEDKVSLDREVKKDQYTPLYGDIDRLNAYFSSPRPDTVCRQAWRNFQRCFYLATYGGLRIGETLGLDWPDVDFARGRLEITKALKKSGIGPTKTKRDRSLPIVQFLYDRLFEQREGQPPTKGRLIVNANAPHRDRLYLFEYGQWREMLAQVGVRYFAPHALRRFYCSCRLALGHNPVEVAKHAGHTTHELLSTYGKVLEEGPPPAIWRQRFEPAQPGLPPMLDGMATEVDGAFPALPAPVVNVAGLNPDTVAKAQRAVELLEAGWKATDARREVRIRSTGTLNKYLKAMGKPLASEIWRAALHRRYAELTREGWLPCDIADKTNTSPVTYWCWLTAQEEGLPSRGWKKART